MKSTGNSSILRQQKPKNNYDKPAVNKRKQVLEKEKEKSWYIPPSGGIPVYRAETDPNCPIARIKKFNDEQKLRMKEAIKQEKRSENWIRHALDTKFEDVPLRINVGLRTKALEVASKGQGRPALADVEILQKIIVRERLLSELARLLKSGSDVMAVLGEVSELIKALRFETLEIIEEISRWQQIQGTPRPFLFKGMNYLIKIAHDLDFLDQYDDVIERFCFDFKCNPLAYRGGGNVITGREYKNSESYLKGILKSYYEGGLTTVDGIDVVRLHNAEKIVQNEFNRIAELAKLNKDVEQSYYAQNETTGATSNSNSMESLPNISNTNEGNSTNLSEKSSFLVKKKNGSASNRKSAFNDKRVKLERIQVLKEEAGELQAMLSHIQEKVQALVQSHRELQKKKKLLDQKFIEAKSLNREVACQHLAAEIFVVNTEVAENGGKIKDLQRESYFIDLERKRKLGVLNKLKEEIAEQQRKAQLKKQIEEKIKREGLMAALQSIQIESESTKDDGGKGLALKRKKKKKDKKQIIVKDEIVGVSPIVDGQSSSSFSANEQFHQTSKIVEEDVEDDEEEFETDEEGEEDDDGEEGEDEFEEDDEQWEEGHNNVTTSSLINFNHADDAGYLASQDREKELHEDDEDDEEDEEEEEMVDDEVISAVGNKNVSDFELSNEKLDALDRQALSPFEGVGNNDDDSPLEVSDNSLPVFGNIAEPSIANSLNYSRHEDDQSDIFPFKHDISFVSDASELDYGHVAGSGLHVVKALKDSQPNY